MKKKEAMNEMLSVVRKLRSEGYDVSCINERMSLALRAYNRGNYTRAIEHARYAF